MKLLLIGCIIGILFGSIGIIGLNERITEENNKQYQKYKTWVMSVEDKAMNEKGFDIHDSGTNQVSGRGVYGSESDRWCFFMTTGGMGCFNSR